MIKNVFIEDMWKDWIDVEIEAQSDGSQSYGDWCRENVSVHSLLWYIKFSAHSEKLHMLTLSFKHKKDATLFILRFGGTIVKQNT